MEKRKLLIAEENEDFALALEDALRGLYSLRSCRDGQTALQLMHSFKPDILVLDMMLPGLDGVSLLQTITDAHMEPMVLATTRYYNDYMIDCINRFGVGYMIVKPCDVRATVARIGDLNSRIRQPRPTRPDPKVTVANLLLQFRIAPKHRGSTYLREAIALIMENPGMAITKELYPEVGKRCNADKQQVERCIRTAIEAAWKRRDEQLWRMYFPMGPEGCLERPSNGDFIARLAQILQIDESDGA